MKKKAFLFSGIVLILAAGAGAAYGTYPDKVQGSLKVFDGVIFSETDQAAQKDIIDSIDPVSGKAAKEHPSKAAKLTEAGIEVDKNKKEKTIDFDFDGKKTKLKFSSVANGKKEVVLPNSEEGYQLTPIANQSGYVLDYNGSLYGLDIAEGKIAKMLSDTVGEYDRETLEKKQIENLPLVWGGRARVNPKGEFMIFFSNREAVENGRGDGQLWVKNFKTQEQFPAFSGGYEFIGWGEGNQAFIRSQDTIFGIDLENRKQSIVQDHVSPESVVSYPYLVIPELKSVKVASLTSKKELSLVEGIGRVDMILADIASPKFAMLNFPDPTSFNTNIIVVTDPENAATKVISPDAGSVIETFSWIDSENLLVVALKKGTTAQVSYVVNINKLHPPD
ncbi:hypothetical protein [Paenibacillus humicus]|uniref:hypothetical protein n=1 Tax=Paenibacillus humicus TaxID=412861 RepID=UPI000FD6D346|nr:hypothetical protein [Paenibacillus humicus]